MLARAGHAPLRRVFSSLSSLRTLPYAASTGGGNLPPLLLPLYARPLPSSVSHSGARRGMCFARAVAAGDPACGVSATAASDLSAPYLSVRIRCHRQDAEVLSEALLCFGATSVTVDDDDDTDAGDLDEISVTSIYADGEDVGSSVAKAASSAGLDYTPEYETSVGKQCDWVACVEETYQPTQVADDLWVVPKWRTPPDAQATNIIINAGLAFGTGEHPTTKLCLLFLRKVIKGGERLMDYGTGTGVLGIAALKMGATLSTGLDIDPLAVTTAAENLLLNGLDSNKMHVYLVPTDSQPSCFSSTIDKSVQNKPANELDLESSKGSYNIVVANILLNPLLELVEDIVGYAKPGGIVAVSGLLDEQVPKVKEVYAMYLDNILVSEMDGWACLNGTRRPV